METKQPLRPPQRTRRDLLLEIADLHLRVAEAEDILRAIRNYEVDAVVVRAPEGDQVFAWERADQAYHEIVAQMGQGAATLAVDGTILYANQPLVNLLERGPGSLAGQPMAQFLAPTDQERLALLLRAPEGARLTVHFQLPSGRRIPVLLSASHIRLDDYVAVLLLISDLSDVHQADRVARLLRLSQRLALGVTAAEVGEAAVHGAVQALEAQAGLLAALNAAGTHLRVVRTSGPSPQALADVPLEQGHPLAEALLTNSVVVVNAVGPAHQSYLDWCPWLAGEDGATCLAIPLRLADRVQGGLFLAFGGARQFEPDDRDFALTVGQQCAQALERSEAHSELERRVRARTQELEVSNQRLTEQIAERKQVQQELERSREKERTRVARELHDELGSTLTGLKMVVSRASKEPELTTEARQRLVEASAIVDSAIASVRRLATELRPAALDNLGLLTAMQAYFDEFISQSGLEGRFECQVDGLDLEGERATACFRILQEALTNVARHAEATQVVVRLAPAERAVLLSVIDNGRGLVPADYAARGHLGLLGLHERASFLAATLDLISAPGAGTEVRVQIPIG